MQMTLDVHGKHYNRSMLVFVLMVGTFCTTLNQTLLATAFPTLMTSLNITTSTVQWLSTGFMLVNGIMIPVSAYLIGRIPTKALYMSAAIIFLAGTILAFTAASFRVLLAARLIQAIGVGVTMPLLQTIMLTIFPPEKRGSAMGMVGLVIGLAPAIGPALSGYIIEAYEWRYLFGMIIPIMAGVIFLSIFFMRDIIATKKSKIDVLSVILSTVGFGMMLYGFSSVGNYGWDSPSVYALISLGILLIVFFALRQIKMDTPFLDLSVYKTREFRLATILSSMSSMAMIGAGMVLPLYLQTVRGDTAFQSGLSLLPGALMLGMISPIAGRIFDERGGRGLSIGGFFLLAIGTLPFVFLTSDTPKLYIIILYGVRMFGIAMTMMSITTNGMNALPRHLIGHGTAVNNTVRQVASSIFTAIMISVLTNQTNAQMPDESLRESNPIVYGQKALDAILHGYHWAFFLAAAIAFIGVILAFFIRDANKQKIKEMGGGRK